jgi:hypothetical protein
MGRAFTFIRLYGYEQPDTKSGHRDVTSVTHVLSGARSMPIAWIPCTFLPRILRP